MSSTLNLKFCPNCGERLSYTSFEGYCAFADCLWNNEECTSPGHQDQGARLAASAQVDQVGGTQSQLFEFKDWLVYYLSVSEDFLDEAEYELKHGASGAKAHVHALRKDISEAKAALKFACLFEEQGK